ncbi:MAG: metal-dependent hydrolase, partial [Deltaproteobacteria bacterium]|nr:metal-dependent hydrolase [Deltaproteobacteria bacterium]
GFYMGMPYGDVFGHRGYFHSLFFAFLLSLGVMFSGFRECRRFSQPWWGLGLFFFLLISTHGFLDALTNGGLGVAFFSPFVTTRHFFPWTPLKVSPIGWEIFLSPWGREVLLNEIIWVWIPSFLLIGGFKIFSKILSQSSRNHPPSGQCHPLRNTRPSGFQ